MHSPLNPDQIAAQEKADAQPEETTEASEAEEKLEREESDGFSTTLPHA